MEHESQQNLKFYKNEIMSEPDGDFIENILNQWKGDYKKLENNCAYIQWLFPNKIQGRNVEASPLTEMEAELIRDDPVLKDRVKRAFEMMLDLFGMELYDNCNFRLAPNSDERLKVINVWGSPSFLHITRILLALKQLGFNDLLLPWMTFLSKLIYVEKTLDQAEASFEQFWMDVLDEMEYKEIEMIISEYKQ